jgi:hAT family protein
MIEKFYSMKDAVIAVLASQRFDDSIEEINLTKPDWVVAKELLDFFGLFVKTTTIMQADNYPTLNRTLPEYFRLISRLEAVKDGKDKSNIQCQAIREAAAAALVKMNEYFAKNDSSPTAFVASMCDPRFKLAIFEHLWKDNSVYIKRAKVHFKETYRKYRERAIKQRAFETLDTEPQDNPELDDEDDLFAGYHGHSDLATTESDTWFSQGTIDYKRGDVKAFWLSKGYDFKIIAQMARDHMGVPATSAASERVFSNGGDIITKRRNKLGGNNTRYLLCLRDWGILPELEDEDSDSELDGYETLEEDQLEITL